MEESDKEANPHRDLRIQLTERANALRAQKEIVDKAKAEFRKRVLYVLAVGGGMFLLLVVIGAATKQPAFGGIAVLVFVGTIFTLQKVTSFDRNRGAGADAAALAKSLLEIEQQLADLDTGSSGASHIRLTEAITALQQGNTKTKRLAIEELARRGLGDSDAIKALVHATQDSNVSIQLDAIKALGRLAPSEPSAVTGLVALLRSPGKANVRQEAARTLARVGEPAAVATIPLLLHECALVTSPLYLRGGDEVVKLFGHAAIEPTIADAEKTGKILENVMFLLRHFPDVRLPHRCLPLLTREYEKKDDDSRLAIEMMAMIESPCPELVARLERWQQSEKDPARCTAIREALEAHGKG